MAPSKQGYMSVVCLWGYRMYTKFSFLQRISKANTLFVSASTIFLAFASRLQ